MSCSSCAQRRKALAAMARAVVARDRPEVKDQGKAIGRSVRRDLASLRKLGRRR